MPKPTDVTTDVIAHAIAECLKARRTELDWSATDVQEHGGPTYHTVLKTEAGKLPSLPILERHVIALGFTPWLAHFVLAWRLCASPCASMMRRKIHSATCGTIAFPSPRSRSTRAGTP